MLTLTQSLVTRYAVISDSMVFLRLGFIEKKKKRFDLSYYKLEKICSDDVWALYWAVVAMKLALELW